jgi:CBS domain containing-hemolysin-like protein
MIAFICALLLLLISLTLIVMQKSYYAIPAKEIKRRAAYGDEHATRLYKAIAYGENLDLLLWIMIALSSAGGFVLFTIVAPDWISFIAVVLLLFVFYSLIPSGRITSLGSYVTSLFTPFLAWLLSILHPAIRRGAQHLQKRQSGQTHTGLYERSDLLELIEQQLQQEDSRFSPEELMIAAQALGFSDATVHDIVTPWSSVKTLSSNDVVGPVVINEAHNSGQPLVPVVEQGRVVGTLRVQQLGIRSEGKASDLMDQAVYYLHEDDSLSEALHAFYVTNQPLFVVLGSKGEYIGVITMSAMLKRLLGELPGSIAEA